MGKVLLQPDHIILTFLIAILSTEVPIISAAKQSSISTNITDQSTLLTLKAHVIEDPDGILSQNWTTSTSFCNWFGVICSNDDTNVTRRVTGLDLSGMGLVATIPSEIGNLSYIQYLNVSGNRFHGILPLELGYLSRLRVLNLTLNEFEGEIPSSLGMLQGLQFLMLGNNGFTGSIPFTLSHISSLRGLRLYNNSLVGGLPGNICDHLPNIEVIDLYNNQLSGHLPSSISKCRKLRKLSMGYNTFTGEIPQDIGMLSSLQVLHLGDNNITGDIPSTLFNISSLQEISLINNNLVGGIPGNICDHLSNIEVISLENNQLSGHLPSSISKCQKLRKLYLGHNSFTGKIPHDTGMLSSFQVLDLRHNSITGMIPTSITNLTTVKHINLRRNHLSGSLPKDTRSWSSSLEVFSVTENNISGHLWDSYCNLSSLQWLGAGLNHLIGSIPDCIRNLQNLRALDVGQNMLTGPIPKDLGLSQPNLQYLYLDVNALTGTIPSSISNATKLEEICLSGNQLTGSIPTFFGNLPDLQYLDLMDNYLTVEMSGTNLNFFNSLTRCRNLEQLFLNDNPLNIQIPSSIGNFSTTLREIDMGDCMLHGGIPEEIGDLTSLTYLNLSHNDFSRSMIPTTLGKLIKLQKLYLQSSGLEGKIPSELCLAQDIGNVYLHENKLSGSIPSCLGDMRSLIKVKLDDNELNSSIPATIGNLRNLVRLNMAFNNLSGSLPSEIGGLWMVAYVNLTGNQLSGTIPSTINGFLEITELYLSDNKFQGSIPEEIGKLRGLESLDLSHNEFSGGIPKGLEALSNLHYFNVSFNKLEGEIPGFMNFTAQSFMGNPALCGPPRLQVPPCPQYSKRRSRKLIRILKIALPLVVASALVMVLLVLLFTRRRRRRVRNHDVKTGDHNLPTSQARRRISYLELLSATNRFSDTNLLGAGAFGSVYKAVLPDGLVVAVKVFHMQMQESMRSFETECEILKNIKHRNLVKVISCCSNLDFKALVLEYMPEGNLDELLHVVGCDLDLRQRLKIMIDVASAIEYLHHGYSSPVVHRDLKPSNVLLDDDLVAHVSDFGLAKLLDEKDHSETMTKNLATLGYMAPEYGSGGLVSVKCDVYSFGVIMMETFTGKKPTDAMFEGDTNLKCWVTESVQHNSCSLIKIVDPRLLDEEEQLTGGNEQCVRSVMELALQCTDENPKARMSMIDILACLKKIHTVYCRQQENRRRHDPQFLHVP